MMDGRRSHRATQYGDLPGSVARVFAGGEVGHGRREREAGQGGDRSAEAAKRSEKASPPLQKHWRKSKQTAMAPPLPRGWTDERGVLTEGVQEKLQL